MRSDRPLFALFALALFAVFTVASSVFSIAYGCVATRCTYAYGLARDLVKTAVAKFEQPALRLAARPAELVRACAYALRIAKRERPQVCDQWRMCPST